jgi:beta-galactosidase
MRRLSLNDNWLVRPKVNRFAEMFGAPPEWEAVTLPHDAMLTGERSPSAGAQSGYFVGGNWEYRRPFEAAVDDAPVMVLEFEGVYRDAVVSVNGTVAAHRPYGYSNFFVPIDHLLRRDGEDELRVEARAADDSRWYSGAGIYRDVWLRSAGPVHLAPDGLAVRTPEIDGDGAVVTVAAVVRNQSPVSSQATLRVEVIDAGGAVVARSDAPVTTFPGDTITARTRMYVAGARRWSPDDPYLYGCRAMLVDGDDVIDEEATHFGIRTLAVDPERGLRINGEPVVFRGACVHHDNGVLGAATIDRAEERRVELLQAAGFNAIRSAHNPMSTAMLRACDRLGMLVMDETFDMWLQTKSEDDYALRFADWWEADVEAMVRKDMNHPSVILYSIGNEVPDGSTPVGVQVGRGLAEKVRALDDTRFVTQAVTGMLVAGPDLFDEIRDSATATGTDEETGINTAALNLGDIMVKAMLSPVVSAKTQEAFAHLDVAGYNYMASRFELDRELFPHRVIVATESHPPSLDTDWAAVLRNPQVIGDFTWTGWDYLGEAGIGRTEYGEQSTALGMAAFLGDYPWLTAGCADFDITGQRRPQSYYREIVWGLRTDPYLAIRPPEHHGRTVVHSSPWSWSDVVSSWTWEGHEGAPVTVEVYADADEVELLLDGRSLGRRPAGAEHRFRAEFETVYDPGVLEAVARRGGAEIGRMSLRSATGAVVLEARADRKEIATDLDDLAFVELRLVDEAGSLYTSADRPVTVELDGPGVLQGLGSANPCTEERFTESTCTTFGGRALAVVRPTGAGTITVIVTADGCDPVRVSIDAQA